MTAIVSAPTGGYWLITAHGNVYNKAGAPWYGSAARTGLRSFTGLAPTPDGHGYWLATSAGRVFAYGDAPSLPGPGPAHPLIGIAR